MSTSTKGRMVSKILGQAILEARASWSISVLFDDRSVGRSTCRASSGKPGHMVLVVQGPECCVAQSAARGWCVG
jgi:hypothetical protein